MPQSLLFNASDATDDAPKLLTSNFAKLKSLPSSILPVSIARYPPRWYSGEREIKLAPSADALRSGKSGNHAAYDESFFNALFAMEAEEVYQSLTGRLGISPQYEQIALLCWCPAGDLCHRRYVAEWFESHLGIVVPEFGMPRDAVETFCAWK